MFIETMKTIKKERNINMKKTNFIIITGFGRRLSLHNCVLDHFPPHIFTDTACLGQVDLVEPIPLQVTPNPMSSKLKAHLAIDVWLLMPLKVENSLLWPQRSVQEALCLAMTCRPRTGSYTAMHPNLPPCAQCLLTLQQASPTL